MTNTRNASTAQRRALPSLLPTVESLILPEDEAVDLERISRELPRAIAEIRRPRSADKLITCTFTVACHGIDGFRRPRLDRFSAKLREACLAECHRVRWPHPETVVRAEATVVVHGSHFGPETLAELSRFFGEHLCATPNALVIGTPTIIKTGLPVRIEISVRAIEITAPENGADKAARLARETAAPTMRADGTYENQLLPGDTPAFVHGQRVAEIHPLDKRLDRLQRSAHVPDPDIETPITGRTLHPDITLTGGGGRSSKGRARKRKPYVSKKQQIPEMERCVSEERLRISDLSPAQREYWARRNGEARSVLRSFIERDVLGGAGEARIQEVFAKLAADGGTPPRREPTGGGKDLVLYGLPKMVIECLRLYPGLARALLAVHANRDSVDLAELFDRYSGEVDNVDWQG